jgi:hypothetical protein
MALITDGFGPRSQIQTPDGDHSHGPPGVSQPETGAGPFNGSEVPLNTQYAYVFTYQPLIQAQSVC